jgi:hypothetical protein
LAKAAAFIGRTVWDDDGPMEIIVWPLSLKWSVIGAAGGSFLKRCDRPCPGHPRGSTPRGRKTERLA